MATVDCGEARAPWSWRGSRAVGAAARHLRASRQSDVTVHHGDYNALNVFPDRSSGGRRLQAPASAPRGSAGARRRARRRTSTSTARHLASFLAVVYAGGGRASAARPQRTRAPGHRARRAPWRPDDARRHFRRRARDAVERARRPLVVTSLGIDTATRRRAART